MADTSPDENGSNSAVEQKTKKPSVRLNNRGYQHGSQY